MASSNLLAGLLEQATRIFPRTEVCRTALLITFLPLGLFFTPVGHIIASRASNAMIGAIILVWVGTGSLGMSLCWDSQKQRNGAVVTTPSASQSSLKPLLMMLFCVLLLVITVGFLVLFGSGMLRFGLEGPFVFMAYVLAGLVAAVVCFGILSSHAQASGTKYGITLMLGGPVVALALVAGGGAYYEQRVRPLQSLAVRVYFYSEDRRERVPVKGTFCLELPNRSVVAQIDGEGGVSFLDLPVSLSGRAVAFSLNSIEYQIHPEERAETILLGAQERILLRVKKRTRK